MQVKGSLIINDSLLMLDAAASGAGIVYTTEEVIKERVRAGEAGDHIGIVCIDQRRFLSLLSKKVSGAAEVAGVHRAHQGRNQQLRADEQSGTRDCPSQR